MIKTKSVYSPVARDDGLRLLVSRFRGRGLTTNLYDVWMAQLGPSEKLLKGFLSGRVDWKEYEKRYKEEILSSPEIDRNNRTILNHGQKFTLRLLKLLAQRQTITLMCQCGEDEMHCHRHILKKLIEKA